MLEAAPRRFTLLRLYCQGTAIFTVVLAGLVLCGWAFHIEILKSVVPGLVSMKANTALGLALSGISLWLSLPGESHTSKGQIARLLGILVSLIGVAVLIEYLFGMNLQIDELLFRDHMGTVGTSSPGRLSPLTAIAFIAIGVALSLLDWKTRRGHRPAQGIILLAMTIGIMAINGYIFRALAPDRILLGTQVALHTGIVTFLLSGAILFARPRDGIASYLTGEGSGSVMARRFLPAVFCVPVVLGWVRMQGQLAGLYGTELGLTLYCTSNIIVFAIMVWSSARQMNREYEERHQIEEVRERLAAVVESSDDAIISETLEGIITAWNRGAEKLFGYSAIEAIGKSVRMLIPPDRKSEELDILERIGRSERVEHLETVRTRKDGKKIEISVTISPVRDANGAIVGASKIARDVTDRNLAQKGRRESEESFQAMANGIPQLAWMAAADGGIFWYNQRWYDYTGTTPEQMEGWGWKSVHDPEVLPAVMERWTAAIAGGTAFEMEFPLRAANGHFASFLTRVLPVKDHEGRVVRWFGTNTDVSERKRANEQIEAQARQLARSYQDLESQTLMLQSVLDSMTEGLAAVDDQGNFIIWNAMAEKLLGFGKTDLPAEQWNEHYGLFMNDTVTPFPTDQMPVLRAIRGEASRTEMFVRNRQIPEGTWIEVYAGPRYTKEGVMRGGVAAFRDITKLKADEREIRRLNEKLEQRVAERTAQLEAANQNLADHKFALDQHVMVATTDLEGTITYANDKFCAINQYTKEELVGQNHRILQSGEHSTDFFQQMFRTITSGQVWRDEICNRAKDGSLYWVDTTIVPFLGKAGKPSQYLAIRTDITERKRAQEFLKQSHTDQIRFKDEFLSHVSHELRSPLTAIKQFTSILLGGMAGAVTVEQHRFLEIVFKNVVQLQAMIDDLLEISRMESGKLTVHPVSMSVLEAVTDACNTHRLSADAKGVSLSWEPPPDLPFAIADPTRLRQILIILLDNALKFTPPGGAVKVQVRPLPQDPQFLLLEVSDTGCGMSPEAAAKAFDRLYQVAGSSLSRKGMGLGLFIRKELVALQGGQIWVQSQPQVGSVFSFTLPVFSLGRLIAPLLKDEKWPKDSISLLTVGTSFRGAPPRKEFEEEWAREVRALVGLCLMPNLDVLLPRMKFGAEGERFYVVAFADDKGASTLARRIQLQSQNLPLFKNAGLTLSVSYTMLNPFPSNTAAGVEHRVTLVAKNVEELIKSQEHTEGIRDEQ